MAIGTMVKITEGMCKGKIGAVTEIFTLEHETQVSLMDGITAIIINSDYMEAL